MTATPMATPYASELRTALAAVRTAARLCQSVQTSITDEVLEKRDRSPVTVADFGAQAVVCRALGADFPNDPVIGEEGAAELRLPANELFLTRITAELAQLEIDGDADQICRWIDRGDSDEYSNRFWTLDPIDGTKGFLRGEQYAISLALIVGGNIEVAVLGCPNLPAVAVADGDAAGGSLFYAVRGHGSFVERLDGAGDAGAIHVSTNELASHARFCESVESGHSAHGHSAAAAERLGIQQPPVRLDSQAKYAVVARGEADVYLRLPTRPDYNEKIWDHAGGVLVVEEAGGIVTDVAGKPLEFAHGSELLANRGVVVTNGLLHDQVLAALQHVGVQ